MVQVEIVSVLERGTICRWLCYILMNSLKISSLNCQGLGSFQKRRDVFQYLRQKQHSIYFLQDTHFTKKMERQIRAEWGYECVFASNNSRSRGVAILLNNNFDFKIKKKLY